MRRSNAVRRASDQNPPIQRHAATGHTMATTRTESDSFGPIEVPADALWGAQTARSLHFFAIGEQRMPLPVIHALAWVKWAAAGVNRDLRLLDAAKADAIAAAALRVAAGEFDAEFPLSVWQTGSGTQSNMNVNEVVARLASRALEATRASGAAGVGARSIHPNDDVNLGQSSNDVFPTAMHIAVALQAKQRAAAGAARIARRAGRQGDGVRRRREDRPHPPAGRDAGDAGPGVRRLRRAARAVPGRTATGARRACTRWPSAARRWAPG